MSEWQDGNPPKAGEYVCWLEGFKAHSEVTWRRSGYALMHFCGDRFWTQSTLHAARKKLDADSLAVTHWSAVLPPPQEP